MIFQTNKGFELSKKKSTLSNGEVLFFGNEQEAEDYVNELNNHLEDEVKIEKVEDVKLTKDQEERYKLITGIQQINLDEVRAYVFDKEEPTANPFWLVQKKEEEIEALKSENQVIMFGLMDVASKLSEIAEKEQK